MLERKVVVRDRRERADLAELRRVDLPFEANAIPPLNPHSLSPCSASASNLDILTDSLYPVSVAVNHEDANSTSGVRQLGEWRKPTVDHRIWLEYSRVDQSYNR